MNWFGGKKSQSQNYDNKQGTSPNVSRRGGQDQQQSYRLNEQQIQECEQLRGMLKDMGMETAYNDQEIIEGVKHYPGNPNMAIEMLMNGQITQYVQQKMQNQNQQAKHNDQNNQQPDPNGRRPQDVVEKAQITMQQHLDQEEQWNVQQEQLRQRRQQMTKQNETMEKRTKAIPEPIPPNERQRDEGIPSGLKNVGNTCYFASFVQCLFHLPNIQEKILNFDQDKSFKNLKSVDKNPDLDEVEKIKIVKSKELVVNLQKLFTSMLLSNVKYQDPTKVLESVVDDNGVGMSMNEQKDIGEFFMNFFDRLQDGLGENKSVIRKLMGNELLDSLKFPSSNSNAQQSVQLNEEQQHILNDIQKHNSVNTQQDQEGSMQFDDSVRQSESIDSRMQSETQDKDINSFLDREAQIHSNGGEVPGGTERKIADIYGGQPDSFYFRQQSMMDPDKKSVLMNYDLDEFKNSIWENFLGSQIQISKVIDADGQEKITNQNVDKLGPIQLQVDEGNLYSAWDKSRRSEIEGYKGDKPGQKKFTEQWICRPPNVMLFQINRVKYDAKYQKLVKDNSRFDFDKTVYLDLFLNQNQEKSNRHMKELDQLKVSLKKLKETYAQYTTQRDVANQFTDVMNIIDPQGGFQSMVSSVQIQSQKFDYLGPDELNIHPNTSNIPANQLQAALSVLNSFKKAAEDQTAKIKAKIEQLEQIISSPFTKERERPYLLHAILIHDGLAENGHYYTYLYDRNQKLWWCINDHKVFPADEAQVTEDCFGGKSGYKNVCNLVYISKHVANEIEKIKTPIYTQESAQRLSIAKPFIMDVNERNNNFTLEVQHYIINSKVQRIQNAVRDRTNKLEQQEVSLEHMVQIKLYSFCHYLRKIQFKGFAKWVILNQSIKEEHPAGLSLQDIIRNNYNKANEQESGATPQAGVDEIYTALLKSYQDQFMSLTKQEEKSLNIKQEEYKTLLKKSTFLCFMLMNMNTEQIKNVINVYVCFRMFAKEIVDKKHITSLERINDFDTIGFDIIQVFVIQHIQNMIQKYRSSREEVRRDALYSARLAAALCSQMFNKQRNPYKQFEHLLREVTTWFVKQTGHTDGGQGVQQPEIDNYQNLLNKFTKGSLSDNDVLDIVHDYSVLPQAITDQFKQIEEIDCFMFVEEIDVESCAYKYFNALNQFRYEFNGQIQMHSILSNKNNALNEEKFCIQLAKHGLQNRLDPLFSDNFDFNMIFGKGGKAGATNVPMNNNFMRNSPN